MSSLLQVEKKLASNLELIEDNGLKIGDSAFSLDSWSCGKLSILSSSLLWRGNILPQIMATEETVSLLQTNRVKFSSIRCQYNRPFSLGKYGLEFLPSGGVLGGASIYIECGIESFFYGKTLQSCNPFNLRRMQLKQADTLILGAYDPDPMNSSHVRKQEKQRLRSQLEEELSQGLSPVIVCPSNPTAQELTKYFTEKNIKVSVHQQIFRNNRIYEKYGVNLGSYSLLSKKPARNTQGVVEMYPFGKSTQCGGMLAPGGPAFFVHSTSGPTSFRPGAKDFYLPATLGGSELTKVIEEVAPKSLYFIGPYADLFLKKIGEGIPIRKALFPNNQQSLLF